MKIELPQEYEFDVLHLEFIDYRTPSRHGFGHRFNVGFYTDPDLAIETLRKLMYPTEALWIRQEGFFCRFSHASASISLGLSPIFCNQQTAITIPGNLPSIKHIVESAK